MAVKSIIDIEVNDAAFKAFKALFDKHKKELDKLPDVWNETNDAIDETVDKADSLLHAIEHQTNILNKQLITQIKISEEMKKTDRNMVSIGSNSGKVLKNIQGITFSMLKWSSLAAAFGLLSGTTGFFGLDALARGASQTRQQAGSLGLNPGQLQAVQTVYGRFSGASSALGGISSAQIRAGDQWPLLGLGISKEDIENKTSAALMPDVMSALHRDAQRSLREDPNNFSYNAESFGWTKLMSLPELRELAERPKSEVDAANKSLPETLERLKLGKGDVSKWEDFIQSIDTSATLLKNNFITGLQNLAIPLGHVVDAFSNLVTKIFDSPGFKKGIDSFADWINNFAENMAKPEFKEAIDLFIDTVTVLTTKFVSLLEWLAGTGKKDGGTGSNGGNGLPNKKPLDFKGTQEQWEKLIRGEKPVSSQNIPVHPGTAVVSWIYDYASSRSFTNAEGQKSSFWGNVWSGIKKGFSAAGGGTSGANYVSPMDYNPPPMQGAPSNNPPSARHFAYGEQYAEAKEPGAFSAIEEKYGLPSGLLAQIHKQEWDPKNPVSSAGAMGPFQFMPGTAADYGLDSASVWDIKKSAEAAGRYFRDLLKMFGGDVNKAAAGYNWGQGNVKKTIDRYGENWRDYLPPETAKYLNNLNRSGLAENSLMAQPGQGIKIAIYNSTGGQVNAVFSALAA